MKKILTLATMLFLLKSKAQDYPIQPVTFTQVKVKDQFWQPKMKVNADITIDYILKMMVDHGRIDNFLAAAGKKENKICSEFPFDDTDLYKWIEGASYALQVSPNPRLSKKIDSLIQLIEDAQEPDGYLFTFRSIQPEKPHDWVGNTRWLKDSVLSHELYNSGHLYEAAFAHYNATGKRSLLNIALKNADLICRDFGPGKLAVYPGHQIIEIGLAKLYRITQDKKYLDAARYFLDIRGPNGETYNQAHQRVTDQREAVGHAVRAAYMYSGMADVAALTGDKEYLEAIDKIWEDVVYKKIYITGGIGSTNNGEAFGTAYDLPNMSAYAETCAAIANVYWNNRMFLLHGDAKYIDVLERTLYNGLLSGMSLDGTHFFYPNPLASVGQHSRSPWFSCACCISNMTRFLPSVPGYVYAQNNNDLYVNLFMSNISTVQLNATRVNLVQETSYPWKGKVMISVNPEEAKTFALRIRIPGWVSGQIIPGDLYSSDQPGERIIIFVNAKPYSYTMEKGYAVINRSWKKGDKVSFELPMKAHHVLANAAVKADQNRFAFQYGPIVYCLEGADHKDSMVQNIFVDRKAPVMVSFLPNKLNGINQLSVAGAGTRRLLNSTEFSSAPLQVRAIPYFAWNNRGPGEMMVWIPYIMAASRPQPAPTIAYRSKIDGSTRSRSLRAINDQFEPDNSIDNSIPYFHWWPKKNTKEWISYTFDKPQIVSSSKVYWYDDGPWGGCRIPAAWKIYYQDQGEWKAVVPTSNYEIAKDRYNQISFEPVNTTALKLEVQLPFDNAAGVHEWVVE